MKNNASHHGTCCLPRLSALIIVLLAVAVALLAGCGPQLVRSDIASYTDPAYQGQFFPSLIVQAEAASLQERQAIERSMSENLRFHGVQAVESFRILPSTRDYTHEQARAALARYGGDNGVRGVLLITPERRAVLRDYVPPIYHGSRFERRGPRDHPVFYYEEPFYQGGYYIRRPSARYSAAIFHLPGFEKAWTAEMALEGSAGTDFPFLDANLPALITGRMLTDRVIMPAEIVTRY